MGLGTCWAGLLQHAITLLLVLPSNTAEPATGD